MPALPATKSKSNNLGKMPERMRMESQEQQLEFDLIEVTPGVKLQVEPNREFPTVADVERAIILWAFKETGESLTKTGVLVGLSRNAVRYKLKSYGVDPKAKR